ncbi:hypothetical protein JKL49_03410 [Phenylobacterium sp. 20VBR1]|uniref:GIY-YIG domain-containing protein n=1 Tax=Phenylobacterium glaciei TaxID=2803784 RepID=A0A941CXE3_9CAUL|nr:hypothetical protein [Phenylobacterium glaciei]MBR7618426.1 hypothetical protein [Phenylobacterium glaciei]
MTSVIDEDSLPALVAKARRAALTLKAVTHRQGRAKHALHVVLLEDRRRSPPWGFYVGETSRDPDLRFDQHKTGYKASRYVNRFGVRLLPDVVEHLNPLRRWEAKELEAAVAEAFREAGLPWVEGGH